MPAYYEQVSTDPLRFETHGRTPVGIAKLILTIGVGGVVLCVAANPVLPAFGEEAAGLGGLGLILFGLTALVGVYRLGLEEASRSIIVTQPRVLEITAADSGRARVLADRRTFFVDDVRRVELHTMIVGGNEEAWEERFTVGIVFGTGIVELQFDELSAARATATTLCQRLGQEAFLPKKRPIISGAIGLAGGLTLLCFFAFFGVGIWPITRDGDLMITLYAASIILGGCGLIYVVARHASKSAVLETVRRCYGLRRS